ncbi:MAG TPA: LysM peptidoglycan-binding domain-containing protein [Thermoclostridium sp.]
MSDLMKVNASVYSRKGLEQEQNRDDFYMNGKFLSEHHIDNMEASIDNRASEFFFAVADHMEFFDDEQKVNFSILRELGKFHEKITVQDGDVDYKTKELTTRVAETAKYVLSFHEMSGLPKEALERQMGFAGLLLTNGKAVVATYGTCHVFYCHNGVVKHITGYPKSKNLPDPIILSGDDDEEQGDEFQVKDDDVFISQTEPIELCEGDKFLLISDGIYDTLGEEYIEDILSMRSDSTYIAYRAVNEAMSKECIDDMTAMVVSVEKIRSAASGAPPVKKPAVKQKTSELKNVPPPTYKYKKKNIRKYENVIYYAAVFMTAVLLILILFFVIKNIMRNLSDPGEVVIDTTPIPTLSPTPTPEAPPEDIEVTPEPTPTEAPVQVTEHIVQKGDTLSSIARKYYGDNFEYVEKLGKYNNIPAPYNTIILGQKIKIPPLEELLKVE